MEVYIRNTEGITSPENCLAFLIDYFQALKADEPVVLLQANKVIEALHVAQMGFDDIKHALKPKIC